MARRRQCRQATSEREIAVAPLSQGCGRLPQSARAAILPPQRAIAGMLLMNWLLGPAQGVSPNSPPKHFETDGYIPAASHASPNRMQFGDPGCSLPVCPLQSTRGAVRTGRSLTSAMWRSNRCEPGRWHRGLRRPERGRRPPCARSGRVEIQRQRKFAKSCIKVDTN
jgi:hypothetical protein